ncbi:hypothetical protein CHLRE_02g100300v5 [Chlamydomonas reinhardtii]|uniref:1-phosphatidylinositol 4-kinase n=1 Tax=Chlamydomonas reinhardtii TaxID=3055 RepID=A0A2K3E283_CHLRE|nr:uncharacterized protein CHLRE_02g100300v5 [Chlamydomonas reinhardtii]PNW86895.1 hypothetical protein CHLRE_02g100300v5 [Chlamydomonas reinhardtii]
MSNVAVEHPRAFPTTVGFRVMGGFELPAAQLAPPSTPEVGYLGASAGASSSPHSAVLTPPQQPPKLSSVPPLSAERAYGTPTGSLLQRAPVALSSSLVSSAPHKPAGVADLVTSLSAGNPESPSAVGWQGLLEFSETSGCSGVLGPKTTSEDLDSILNRDCKIEICCTAHTSPAVRRLVKSVIRGLRACQEPDKAADGMGGTYFFSNEAGKKAAILKPCDEEPLAPNNPKGYVGRQLGDPGWKPTVRVGEAAIREVAAYLLDHDGFARVPTSVLVRARHPVFCYQASRASGAGAPTPVASSGGAPPAFTGRGASSINLDSGAGGAATGASSAIATPASPDNLLPMKLGSLQEFVTHECDTSEMGPGRFSVRDVHRIGIFDLRLFNTDRHAGNMLVRTPRTASASTADLKSRMTADAPYELIPIDHGFCLPETLEAPYFEWLHWPQTMLPFSEDELQYIRELDVERDKAILRQELPILRPECLRVLEVCTTLLKTCAAAGLTLFDIASVMTRPFVDADEEPSELERICLRARQCVEYTARCGNGELESVEESDSEGDADGEAPTSEELLMEEEIASEALGVSRRGPPRRGATISSIKEEGEDMLFELEEDVSGGGVAASGAAKRRAAAAGMRSDGRDAEESSGEYSPCSSLSSGDEHLGSMNQAGSLSSGAMPVGGSNSPSEVTPVRVMPAAGADRPVPMASSVHVTDGFLWRKLKTQQAARRAGGKGGALTCPKRSRMAPQVYPPPVAAFSPDCMKDCFSGMSEEQWQQFMDLVNEQVQVALEEGRWRQSTNDLASGMAMSCPTRF